MPELDELQNGLIGAVQSPVGAAIGGAVVGGALVGAGILGIQAISSRTRRTASSKKRIKHTKRGWKADRKRFNKSQKWEVAYRKHKKSNSKRRGKIYYARKTGQPYIILASGKAKFIKGKRRK